MSFEIVSHKGDFCEPPVIKAETANMLLMFTGYGEWQTRFADIL